MPIAFYCTVVGDLPLTIVHRTVQLLFIIPTILRFHQYSVDLLAELSIECF